MVEVFGGEMLEVFGEMLESVWWYLQYWTMSPLYAADAPAAYKTGTMQENFMVSDKDEAFWRSSWSEDA
jgi:hypothetical protein